MGRGTGVGRLVRGLFRKPGGGREEATAARGKASEGGGAHDEGGPKGPQARLGERLVRTRDALVGRIEALVRGRPALDDEFFGELEAVLIQADVGVKTTDRLLANLKRRTAGERPKGQPDVMAMLKEELLDALGPREALNKALVGPSVMMVVGVNGTGKTTTAAKLGYRFRKEGARVILGAADTFRAAAIDQLEVWAQRIGAQFVRHEEGGDPAAVAYDACEAARARKAEYVILDTAGRLHTRANLMEELKKVRRVAGREIAGAPHEVLLVLDATSGQNALAQARTFKDVVEVTGIVLAKLDGTAKGGVVLAIREELGIPVKLIGIGEGVEDLGDFDPVEFVETLFAPVGTS